MSAVAASIRAMWRRVSVPNGDLWVPSKAHALGDGPEQSGDQIADGGVRDTHHDRPHPNASEFIRENLIWLLGLLPFALAGTKLFIVAGADPQLLRTFLQSLNIVQLMLATIVPLFPVVAFWGCIGLWGYIRYRARTGQAQLPDWVDVPIAMLAVTLVTFMPAGQVLVNVGLLVFLAVLRRLFRWIERRFANGESTIDREPMWPDYLQTVVFAVVGAFETTPTMWLPMELIDVKGASRAEVGYVISQDGDWITILNRTQDDVQIYKLADIESRTICSITAWPTKPVIDLIFRDDSTRQPSAPPCSRKDE